MGGEGHGWVELGWMEVAQKERLNFGLVALINWLSLVVL